jgi:predicted Ser/Thr protein kinase
MTPPSTDAPITEGHISHRPLLWLMRVTFFLLIVPTLVFNVVTLPMSYDAFYDVLEGSLYDPIVLPASFALAQVNPTDYGFSLEFIATFYTAFNSVLIIGAMVVGLYIFYRRSNEWMAALTGAVLGTLGATYSPVLVILLREPSGEVFLRFYILLFTVLLVLFTLLFPTGRFVPRWTRWLIPPLILVNLLVGFEFGLDISFGLPLNIVFAMVGIYTQIRRYFHVSTPIQRQQTKWAMFGLITFWVFMVGIMVLKPICIQLGGVYFMVWQLIGFPFLVFGGFIALTLGLSFSVLRYNLWQVDLMMNRGAVYLNLSVVLVAVFFGIILLLHSLLDRLFGEHQTPLVTIIATAAVALAFHPTRHRIQHQIDRRMFRLRADIKDFAAAQKDLEIKNPGLYTGRTFGNYETLGVLGKGGMGEVYKGVSDGHIAAIKVLPKDIAQDEELRKRFIREGETLRNLHHANIVKLYEAGTSEDGIHYLVMEQIEGQELTAILRGKEYDYADICRWVKGVASALDYVHSKGLVHRDLKPSNIMLRSDLSDAVLMDFGIAHDDSATSRLTGSGTIGTVDYMSPEQMMAASDVDKRSDVYALGVIVFELLTGERPFKGSAGQVLFAHLQQPAPDPRTLRPDVPREMAKAVLKALEKKPDARYPTAGEFAAALSTSEASS